MRDYQTALAIWDKDIDIEKDFDFAPDVTRTIETPDETYIVYYWHWTPMPFDTKILEGKRHALLTYSDDDYCEYDFVDTDSRGCDEEFNCIFGWQLAVTVSFDDTAINKVFL